MPGYGNYGPGKNGPGKNGPAKTVQVITVLGKNGPGKKGPAYNQPTNVSCFSRVVAAAAASACSVSFTLQTDGWLLPSRLSNRRSFVAGSISIIDSQLMYITRCLLETYINFSNGYLLIIGLNNYLDPIFQDRFYLGPFLPGPFLPDPFTGTVFTRTVITYTPLHQLMPNTPPTRLNCRVASRRRRRREHNSKLVHDDCRRIRLESDRNSVSVSVSVMAPKLT